MSKPTTASFDNLAGLDPDYDQIQKVAIGGMAEVYRGRQKSLDRSVAIKRIRDELKDNPGIQVRFRREATKAANLLHQNLAHVYDYRVVEGEAYIIMEFIDGFDLAHVLEQQGILPPDVAAMVAVKILNGLSYVHTHGMVHRDLKPDNIRINSRGEVKIMDFGITLDPSEENLTQPGIIIGSPHYLSPEQVRGEKLDARSDLFAFGILFYEILCGQKPFRDCEGESVYQRIQKAAYEPLDKVRPDLPAFLRKIVDSCLRLKAKDRPAKAEDVAQNLQEFLLSNHSLSMDQRIKKFLMETTLLPGNPSLMEISERTLPPPGRVAWWKRLRLRGVLVVLASMTLGAMGWEKWGDRVRAIGQSPQALSEEATPVPAKPRPKAKSKPKVKPKPVDDLPGKPVK